MALVLYKKQREILDFVSQYIQAHNQAPRLQDIADAIKVRSLATVHEHLCTLVDKGIIRRKTYPVRSLEIIDSRFITTPSSPASVDLPVLGYIAAGQPIEPFLDPNVTLNVPSSMLPGKRRSFVLQVKGDSMIEAGILDHDYVVIEQAETANNGEVVVALLDNGFATLKRFFKEATRVRLEPANAAMAPIFVNRVKIQGKVVGVIRKYAFAN